MLIADKASTANRCAIIYAGSASSWCDALAVKRNTGLECGDVKARFFVHQEMVNSANSTGAKSLAIQRNPGRTLGLSSGAGGTGGQATRGTLRR